ncbi:hypothetical protein SALBM217S_06682 [Streptomyces griseoloalbus]
MGALARTARRALFSAGYVFFSIWSVKVVPYRSLHGLPLPAVSSPALPQAVMALMKVPLSLPPIVSVTRSVSAPSAFTCGGTPRYCDEVKSLVSAAPQVTSLRRAPVRSAITCG